MPQGALTVADNVIIDRNGVIEPRRGNQQYGITFGTGSDIASQLMTYKKRLLMQFNSTIQYDSDGAGTWEAFSGTYTPVQAGLRTKYAEANGNFYFTSATGIQCISATASSEFTTAANYIRPSGAPQALDLTGSLDYSAGGWFIYQTSSPGQSKVAYRMTWAFKDPNTNLVEGVASSRLVLTNYSETDAATVNLTFQIPKGVNNTNFFYTIYRTAVVQTSTGVTLNTLDPGDEEYQVIQNYVTSADLTAGTITVNDPTPESFRANGALLYSNPVSGVGILQSNYPPPLALDMTLYQQTLFFANTQTIQQLNLALLSTEALVSGTSYVEIDGDTNQKYTFVGSPEITEFTFDTQANTTDASYFLINSASNQRSYFAWFLKSGQTTITLDASTALTDKSYFILTSPINTDNKYFIWFKKVSGDTAPAAGDTAGRTAIAIDLSGGVFTAAQVASLVYSSLPPADFPQIALSGTDVLIYNATNGTTSNAAVGATAPGGAFAVASANNTTTPSASDTIGKLPIQIDIRQSILDSDVANAFALALDGNNDFTSSVATDQVTVTNSDNGVAVNASVGLTPPGGAFAITIVQDGTGEDTTSQEVLLGNNISPAISIEETARSLVKNINANPNSSVEAFYISGPTDLPGLILLQSLNISDPAFSIIADSTNTGNEFSPSIPTTGTTVISTNTSEINAIYYSKFQQPESVPIVNKFNVGPKDKAILRILPIRTGLMIFKEDGIYQLSGVNGQFATNPFDSSAIMLAPDSGVVLNNQVYMLSTQGVTAVTDTGVSVISRPIENSLQQIISPGYDYVNNTFGVSYESDRAYFLWTVTNSNDTMPTQCFRYNTFTTAWTRWPISKNCGVVLLNKNVLYLGPTDENFIEQERKNINRTDYADRQYDLELPDSAIISNTKISLSSIAHATAGDVLVQTQYLTIYQFNQLVQMLDADAGTAFKQYFSTFGQVTGGDLRAAIDNLATQLDLDTGLAENDFYSSLSHGSNFSDFQSDFNIITSKLNLNDHTRFKNYVTSSGTFDFEMIIDSIINNSNNVNIVVLAPFIVGPVILAKGINTNITWAPQTFGDPSISKHVSEGTFLFDNNDFTKATLSYASDLMPSFESIVYPGSGIGDWGSFTWDEQAWGGNGVNTPMRTYIPRNKQYCRYIIPNFMHNIAREKFALFGTSLTFRAITERAYRS